LSQLAERVTSRGTQIIGELEEIGQEVEREREQMRRAATELENASGQIESLRSSLGASSETLNQADARLKEARQQAERATREHQEGVFLEKTISSKIDGLEDTVRNLHRERLRLDDDAERLSGEIAQVDGISVEAQLQTQLTDKAEHEQALAGKRNAMETLEAQLSAAEKSRLATEQSLQPLRDRIGELRLKEQEARLATDNFAQQLAEAGADLQALAAELEKGVRASQLQGQITRITGEIEALGAINLAALEELGTVRERKAYLDSQAQDLTEALATLENAIRRIDRETRERLQNTFNQVSDKFSEMFPALFGGGEAKLLLTGDEILDAGIQVIARPPGKRNSSIHLLSGGEKALTALALVFSMFQLNPAPFCLLDEVDAPLDDVNTTRYCELVKKMSAYTQFVFITHNKITMELAEQLVGVTMQEQGVSRVVSVDIEDAIRLHEEEAA
jgi:chromosome segregation protein